MHIWVTRTAPDNFLTARRLKDMGHRILLRPAMKVTPVAHDPVDFVPAAILFTSANGVRHHRMQAELSHVPVYAVGNHASELAVQAGYRTVTSTAGDAELVRALLSLAMPERSRIIHYSARKVAPELPRHIVAEGHEYTQLTVYEIDEAAGLDSVVAAGVLATVDGIVLHSARGAERAADLARQARWGGTVWALSEACAEPFRALASVRVHVAGTPAEHALLALIPPVEERIAGIRGGNTELITGMETDSKTSAPTASNDP